MSNLIVKPPLPAGSPRPPAPMGSDGGDVRCACGHKRKHHDGGTEPRWIACTGFKETEHNG